MTMKSPDTVLVKIAIIASTLLLMGKSAEYSHFIVDDCDTTSMANQSFVIDGLSIPMDECAFFCSFIYGTNCKSWLWLQSGVRNGTCYLWKEHWSEYRKTCNVVGGGTKPDVPRILHQDVNVTSIEAQTRQLVGCKGTAVKPEQLDILNHVPDETKCQTACTLVTGCTYFNYYDYGDKAPKDPTHQSKMCVLFSNLEPSDYSINNCNILGVPNH